jgi:diadenosine tetraphosphate (Ap4A) HIT family hydrolase
MSALRGSSEVTAPREMVSAAKDHEAGCIFCRMNDPELNRLLAVYDTCYARWDNFPAAKGHVEIVPKRHVESFFDLDADELPELYELIKVTQKHLSREYSPAGYTIGVNEGRAAGRTIDHLHIHIIPRYVDDVSDPRGGIRNVLPGVSPDLWAVRQRF